MSTTFFPDDFADPCERCGQHSLGAALCPECEVEDKSRGTDQRARALVQLTIRASRRELSPEATGRAVLRAVARLEQTDLIDSWTRRWVDCARREAQKLLGVA